MKIRKMISRLKPPCPKCSYTLGLVHTLVNPCSKCKENGYQMFEQFQRKLPENDQGRV